MLFVVCAILRDAFLYRLGWAVSDGKGSSSRSSASRRPGVVDYPGESTLLAEPR